MNNIFTTLASVQPATASIVARSMANSSTCALIGMVSNAIVREQNAIARGTSEAYAELRDQAQDDNNGSAPLGMDGRLTLNQLVEWTAAIRAYAFTVASGLEGNERRFAEPQQVRDSVDFMATPRTAVGQDQIDAALELMPDISKEQAVAYIQTVAKDRASTLAEHKETILARVEELLNDAPADREMESVFDDLPESYRYGLITKACSKIVQEVDRLAIYVIRGVPGTSAKRKVLSADLPALEALAA